MPPQSRSKVGRASDGELAVVGGFGGVGQPGAHVGPGADTDRAHRQELVAVGEGAVSRRHPRTQSVC